MRRVPRFRDPDDHGAVAPFGLLRLDENVVGRELDVPVGVGSRVLDVDDDPVGRVIRIDFVVQCADQLFVGAGKSPGLPAEHVLMNIHVRADNAGGSRRR